MTTSLIEASAYLSAKPLTNDKSIPAISSVYKISGEASSSPCLALITLKAVFPLSSATYSLVINLYSLNLSKASESNFYPNVLISSEKVVKGYLPLSRNESLPYNLFSTPRVTIDSVFLPDAVFSTIENGDPGLTNVAFINEDPKSIPIKLAETPIFYV